MSEKYTILLTGALGYIGGSVLWRLISHRDANTYNIKALVRNAEKAKLLQEKFGVDAVIGDIEDSDKLEELAQQADVIINTANSDDLIAVEAMLRGVKKRYEKSGKKPIFIHTSGTGVVADNAGGMYASEKVYDDSKVEDIESLDPKTQIHRIVDVEIVAADEAGYARTYIILPSAIYGMPKNGFTEAGIQNQHSVSVTAVILACLARGQGGMVGLGKNIWPNVHIDETADLYVTLLEKVHAVHDSVPHGREGFFFGASGEYESYDVCKAIAEVLVDLGRGKSREPTTFTKEEMVKYFGPAGPLVGSNARCIPTNSLALGWKPTHTTKDFLASIKPELEALISSGRGKQVLQPEGRIRM